MYVMPDSNSRATALESGQAEFSHGLQEFRTTGRVVQAKIRFPTG
jgi:hypothetical protein